MNLIEGLPKNCDDNVTDEDSGEEDLVIINNRLRKQLLDEAKIVLNKTEDFIDILLLKWIYVYKICKNSL